MRFVLVNDRTARTSSCAHCSNAIGLGYLRDMPSRRLYCDIACYSGKKVKSSRLAPGAGIDGLPVASSAQGMSQALAAFDFSH